MTDLKISEIYEMDSIDVKAVMNDPYSLSKIFYINPEMRAAFEKQVKQKEQERLDFQIKRQEHVDAYCKKKEEAFQSILVPLSYLWLISLSLCFTFLGMNLLGNFYSHLLNDGVICYIATASLQEVSGLCMLPVVFALAVSVITTF